MQKLEHLIWWFLISFGGEFVAGMAFGKKGKIFKTRFGISIVSGIPLLLGTFIEARARLISKLFYSNQLNKGCPYLRHRIKNHANPIF
ncbi:hypothetical protein N203_03805 [Helicobacter pylori UM084]|nr:hypothetical protein N203_03805 [Helicobacter pylori UM084]